MLKYGIALMAFIGATALALLLISTLEPYDISSDIPTYTNDVSQLDVTNLMWYLPLTETNDY